MQLSIHPYSHPLRSEALQAFCWNSESATLPNIPELQPAVLQTLIQERKLKPGSAVLLTCATESSYYTLAPFRAPETWDARTATKLGTTLAQVWRDSGKEEFQWIAPETLDRDTLLRVLTALLLELRPFDTYLQEKKPQPTCIQVLTTQLTEEDQTQLLNQVNAIHWARTLGNEPANIMTPSRLAQEAEEKLQALGVRVQVLGQEEILALGMQAFWQVARGSSEEPKLIVLEYLNQPQSDIRVALVGKGLTYDSGGYSLKDTPNMVTMKADMCGAAAVLGAFADLASRQAPVNVVGVIAACENLVSGHAYKPGDIIGSMSGKHIEITNTDAEGRLTLADAVYYAHAKLQATEIVDICTLTGACVVALGESYTGVLTEREDLWASLEIASKQTGDKIWRMPCDPELLEGLRTPVADIKNSGPRWGGMMTAGLFVREFTEGTPWMHLDIAGPSFQTKADGFYPEGATGVGAELLAAYTEDRF